MEESKRLAKIDWQEVLPKFLASIIILLFANFIRLILTLIDFQGWFIYLNKPFFALPNNFYEPIWIILFLLLGIAIFIVWNRGFSTKEYRMALYYFAVMIILTLIWAGIFFGLHTPIGGLILGIALIGITMITTKRFIDISKSAGILLIPYLIWTIYLAIIEAGIILLK